MELHETWGTNKDRCVKMCATWSEITDYNAEMWESVKEITGIDFSKAAEEAKGLTGAIRRGITEETASLIAGQFNAVRLDVKEQISIMYATMDFISNIEENTRYNRHLLEIKNDISSLKNQLTSIGK